MKTYHDFHEWQDAVKEAHPEYGPRIQFKGRTEKGLTTISAEIPGMGRSFGVWHVDGEDGDQGIVLEASTLLLEARSRLLESSTNEYVFQIRIKVGAQRGVVKKNVQAKNQYDAWAKLFKETKDNKLLADIISITLET